MPRMSNRNWLFLISFTLSHGVPSLIVAQSPQVTKNIGLLLFTCAVICPNNIVSALCNNSYFARSVFTIYH